MLTTVGSGKIQILPGDVVSRIAAGEVVERPAAVVKELVENSLDAGSRSIVVDVKNGGLSLIRVVDDGEGMTREDARRAFARHATSKLQSDHDLWSIRTMGFRGEALPSIAAVSRVRMTTAPRSGEVGAEFHVQGETIGAILDAPPVAGTRIEVADLFFNQPARKKFLKSVHTEFAHISRVIQQAALAWPAVHFRLIHNGADILNYPAVQVERDRISQVYRSAFLERCVPVQATDPSARMTGYVIEAIHAKSSRSPQELFVNRRPVRNTTVLHAVAEGYGSMLPKGYHPLFVLFLDIDSGRVDVNVHPTKREVRFSETETIHQLVRRAVRHALGGAGETGRLTTTRVPITPASQVAQASVGAGEPPPQPLLPVGGSGDTDSQLALVSETTASYVRVAPKEVIALGQLNRTFLVVQVGADLVVIDQHTAHERVLFERLFRAWATRGIQSQPLLIPECIEVSAAHASLFQRYQGDLEKLGLELEPFGAAALLLRSIPVGLGKIDPGPFLEDVLDDLAQWDRASSAEEKVRPVLASLACHSAVRAGRSMELPEIKALVEDWRAEGEMTTCPHGRRTSFHLSTNDLEKMFGRAGW